METGDRQLLIRAHRGDEASARALWDRHAGRLTRFAHTILRSPADADDVVQAVFIGVLRLPAAQVRAVEDAGAWLALLTRRQALNHVRSARRRRRHEGMGPAGPAVGAMGGEPGTGARWHEAVADHELTSALDSLARRLREVIVLKHLCGLTFDQIAVALSVNRNTAASRYRVALESLRRALGADSGETGAVRRRGTAVPSMNGVHAAIAEVPHE